MDLKLLDAEATAAERDALDRLLGPPANVWEGADRDASGAGHVAHGGSDVRERRHLLLPALHALHERVGWLSPGGMNDVCRRLGVPPADAYGVATFYALFSVEPRPATVLHVCEDIACRCNGSEALIASLEERIGPEGAEVDGATWFRSPCLGQCDRAPAALLTVAGEEHREHVLAPLDAEAATRALAGEPGSVDPVTPVPQAGDPSLRLLRRIGAIEPTSLDDYRARGGYSALRRAFSLSPEGVIRELKDSNLLGRGGAAFPTGIKWEAVARQPAQPHYLVCNADESEPGTFKDRVLMEGDPFALVEAMTIAAYATDCGKGYVYLRGEYPQAHAILEAAFAEARARGFLGADILGQGFAFDLELRKGAGAYICGEETAIFNSIEGFRGEPRSKPPFPVVSGLFGSPTLVNNVETLVNALDILLHGGPEFAELGTEGSKGTKLFCVSGCVERPGTYEVEFGVTLRELLGLAGGVRDGNAIRGVLLGGAAGGFVGPDELDLALTFEAVREAGATLGSGVILVFDETVDLDPILMQIAAFFRNESCGQCVPCRVGTVRQQEALARLQSRQTRGTVEDEFVLIDEIALAMKDASICGLGQTAAGAIQTAIKRLGVYPQRRDPLERTTTREDP